MLFCVPAEDAEMISGVTLGMCPSTQLALWVYVSLAERGTHCTSVCRL